MRYVHLSEGGFQVVYGSPELSKSYMDMASKLFTLHYITLHYITLHYITLHYIPRST